MSQRLLLRAIIYGILLFTFFAGLPQFHYAAAIMVALILRYKDQPNPLFTPIFASKRVPSIPVEKSGLEPSLKSSYP